MKKKHWEEVITLLRDKQRNNMDMYLKTIVLTNTEVEYIIDSIRWLESLYDSALDEINE